MVGGRRCIVDDRQIDVNTANIRLVPMDGGRCIVGDRQIDVDVGTVNARLIPMDGGRRRIVDRQIDVDTVYVCLVPRHIVEGSAGSEEGIS
jgi:hypothetical protein